LANTYTMTISRLTVDKLGVKLYDRVSAVIAELVANSYDADATEVFVEAPMDELLATKAAGKLVDKNFAIVVKDDGSGMTPEQVNEFYLKVGAERRTDPKRGDVSPSFNRKVMGRKGVGKLAPFGVCQKIEVITSGGDPTMGTDANGAKKKGFVTAHLILDRKSIMCDTDEPYHPTVGKLDGIVLPGHGTTLRLTLFDHRRVPAMEDFERQLSQRFGLSSTNWKIELRDSNKTSSDKAYSREVGAFGIQTMPGTKITLEARKKKGKGEIEYLAIDEAGKHIPDLAAGFSYDGKFYPVVGWVAYSDKPYKDDFMAGVRIYCRGKIAAQSRIFQMKAGFTGEHDVRSYFVGELHADWLDEEDDLIRTDRQDILWSQEPGASFETWGQALIKKLGAMTREPRRKKAWALFEEKSDIHKVVDKAFPLDTQNDIRENCIDIAKVMAQTTREEDLKDQEHVVAIVQLSLLLGPHITLDQKLREAADKPDQPLAVVSAILKTARLAELAGFGRIADDRIKVIKTIETLKDDQNTLESAFQALITNAPWLVNPTWSPISANVTFETLRAEFVKFYKKKTGVTLNLGDFSDPKKRADFVLSSQDTAIQIIEIKKPDHALTNDEMDRIQKYINLMEEFLALDGHQEFRTAFPDFHVTVVCDKLALNGVHKTAFANYKKEKVLEQITWTTFLLRSRKMHEEFLKEAERQRKNAAKN
jgi:hypothetical protein